MKTIGVIPKPTKKRLIQLLTLLESYKETIKKDIEEKLKQKGYKVESIELQADGNKAYVKLKNKDIQKEVNIPSVENFMEEIIVN